MTLSRMSNLTKCMPRAAVLIIVMLTQTIATEQVPGADAPRPVDNPSEKSAAADSHPDDQPLTSQWGHRSAALEITRGLLANAPQKLTEGGKPITLGQPFTYEEQVYAKPARDWWWRTGEFTVILVGGLVLTYFTAGFAAPYVGAAIGGTAGLSGAAAVSYGLAFLGGGAIAAGGFGMAGGTVVIGIVTDLAISTTLEYSLVALRSEESLKPLNEAISFVDLHHEEAWAWDKLKKAASPSKTKPQDYVASCHAVASAFLRWVADENIDRTLREGQNDPVSELRVSDRQRVLSACALRLLEECRRCEPKSSLVHHALGNLYWWLSVRGGYEEPEAFPTDLMIPASARLQQGPQDEVGCFRAALWHFAEGTTCEPRNVNVPISWASALQADGATHEAIAVVAQELTRIRDCRPADQAKLHRMHSMLQYQAFTRTPAWERFTTGGPYPSLEDLHFLVAAMEGYSQAVAIEPGDLASISSLAQIYRDADAGALSAGKSILSRREVQFRLVEGVLGQEQSLAALKKSDLPATYKPGQLAEHYKDLLRWSFEGLGNLPLEGDDLKRTYAAVDGWLKFAASSTISFRPFTRDVVSRLRIACLKYNASAWLDYSLDVLDRELSQGRVGQ